MSVEPLPAVQIAPIEPAIHDPDAVAYHQLPDHPTSSELTYLLSASSAQLVPNVELGIGIAAIVSWMAFFCCGIFVPTGTFRTALWSGQLGFLPMIGHLFVVLTCYALTNIAFLSCIAAFLGCMTRRWYVTDYHRVPPHVTAIAPARLYLSALLRGFFLYLFMIAGFLTVTTEQSLLVTTVDQYVRMAGVASVIAFLIGYDPRVLNRMLSRVMDVTDADVPATDRKRAPASGAARSRASTGQPTLGGDH